MPACVGAHTFLVKIPSPATLLPPTVLCRELGCSDSGTTALNPEGARVRSYRVVLLPHSASEQKRLAEYFPALKLGGKKPGGK